MDSLTPGLDTHPGYSELFLCGCRRHRRGPKNLLGHYDYGTTALDWLTCGKDMQSCDECCLLQIYCKTTALSARMHSLAVGQSPVRVVHTLQKTGPVGYA